MKKITLIFSLLIFTLHSNAYIHYSSSIDTPDVSINFDNPCPGAIVNFRLKNNTNIALDSVWWKGDFDPITGDYYFNLSGSANDNSFRNPTWIFYAHNGIGSFPFSLEVKDVLGNYKTFFDTVEIGEPWINIINDPVTCCDFNDTIKLDVRFLTKPYMTLLWFDNEKGTNNSVLLNDIDKFPVSLLAGRSSIDLGIIIEDMKGCKGRANVFFNLTTNVKEVKKNNIKLFPNPTNNTLYIQGLSKENNNSAIIYSIQGQLIRNAEIINNSEIDLSDLSPGIYMLKINDVAHRIIKF